MQAQIYKAENLIQQHQAIKTQMNYFMSQIKSQVSNSDTDHLTLLKQGIKKYLWSLFDFLETIQRNSELDELFFDGFPDSRQIFCKEHEKIHKQIKIIVNFTEQVVYEDMSEEQIQKSISTLDKAVNNICAFIREHLEREDKILNELKY
jgi:hypothetical protein